MYESPIDIIYGEMQTQIKNDVLKAVQRVSVNVNKEELLKALQYDREQYLNGYEDGLNANRWIPCSERLPKQGEQIIGTFDNGDGKVIVMQEKFFMQFLEKPYPLIAWMPLPKPYKGE